MCTLLFRFRPSDTYPLTILTNRDEAYARLSEGWAWRMNERPYFAPRDLEAGGTWIGLNGNGVVAALTNIFPGRRDTGLCTRGALVVDMMALDSAVKASTRLQRLLTARRYNNFNLLVSDRARAVLFTWQGKELTQRALAPGVYEVDNTPFDGTAQLSGAETNREWLERHADRLREHPKVCRHSGFYGTRCSHKLLVHGSNPVGSSQIWHLEGHPCRGSYDLVVIPELKYDEQPQE
ncbi:MAG: NRDE family protein [Candidatus Neomarinimicrobiota bacterium]